LSQLRDPIAKLRPIIFASQENTGGREPANIVLEFTITPGLQLFLPYRRIAFDMGAGNFRTAKGLLL
jgi:hypothetical protein